MPLLARDELVALTETRPGPCVSIFMPTQRAAPARQQNPIDLKNLVREAEHALLEKGHRAIEIQPVLEPAWALVQNPSAWDRPGDSLALFLAPAFYREYHLPLPVEECVAVGDRFQIKPLLPAFTNGGIFYILAVSQKDVRLFLCTPQTVAQVDLEDVPKSVAEALLYDDPERQVQFHPTTRPHAGGQRGAMFHGHAEIADDAKDDIRHYFRHVDDGLKRLLKSQRAPLVLAGVEFLHPLYRDANTYPNLLPRGVEGNPELLSAKELHGRAWLLVRPELERRMEAEAERYRQLEATTKLATHDVKAIVRTAHQGRIEVLWVALDRTRWGRYEPATNSVHVHPQPKPGDEDLLDLAAVKALLADALIFAVDHTKMPAKQADAAAILRY
jgi:hypothetical protein